jgi:hypothetical protein
MTISMQGSWTVSVKSESAGWAQRFRIAGSSNGADGTYAGDPATTPVFVTGAQWGITVEHNPSGPVSWSPSRHRLDNFRISGGQFLFDIGTDDAAGDEDFNDLVLTCSVPLSVSEYLVYGNVKTYTGACLLNPCYPHYYVIDTPLQLERLLEYAPTRRLIEKLYPERVKPLIRRPFPEPDPAPFRPMMIPTGRMDEPGLAISGPMASDRADQAGRARRTKSAEAAQPSYSLVANAAMSVDPAYKDSLLAIAKIKDSLKLVPCEVTPVSETLLRFMEYDRTEAEKLGDPYTGDGGRNALGMTATDELGNYVFRFSQTLTELAEEVGDIAAGEDLTTQIRPDVILQIMESLPDGVAYESAPYYNIPNVKRINLCLPQSAVGRPPTACQGGRAIQAIGNIFIVPHPGTTLHPDGTISNTSTTGPIVDHAAWTGTLDFYACFLDANPDVEYYTISYRRQGESGWNFVTQDYKHLKKQPDGTWLNTRVGPDPVELRINGPSNPKVFVGAYKNIEEDPEWIFTHRNRKLQLYSSLYQPVAGAVEFTIEGYAANGERVPGAEDAVNLYIDNHVSGGLIDYVKYGTEEPCECAVFDLPSAGEPLSVRYKVTDVEGFMAEYALRVYRGSNTFLPTRDAATSSPVAFSYPFPSSPTPDRFRGTLDQTLDPAGYVEVSLEPTAGAWLPTGVTFCAFSFELTTRDRVTNGYGTPGGRLLWRELIGITYTPPPAP